MAKQKNIAICSIGDYQVPEWLRRKGDYDVCLIYYGQDAKIKKQLARYATYFLTQAGFKMPNYLLAIEQFELLQHYDRFTFIDDDLDLSGSTVEVCFSRLHEYGLDACQPSEVSLFQFWRIMQRRSKVFMDTTNFIECKCMCLSRSVVERMLSKWGMFTTGFGFDLLLRDTVRKFAVFHDVYFFHPVFKAKKYKLIRDSEHAWNTDSISQQLTELLGRDIWSPEPTILKSKMLNEMTSPPPYQHTSLKHKFWLLYERFVLLPIRKEELKPYKGAYRDKEFIQNL